MCAHITEEGNCAGRDSAANERAEEVKKQQQPHISRASYAVDGQQSAGVREHPRRRAAADSTRTRDPVRECALVSDPRFFLLCTVSCARFHPPSCSLPLSSSFCSCFRVAERRRRGWTTRVQRLRSRTRHAALHERGKYLPLIFCMLLYSSSFPFSFSRESKVFSTR